MKLKKTAAILMILGALILECLPFSAIGCALIFPRSERIRPGEGCLAYERFVCERTSFFRDIDWENQSEFSGFQKEKWGCLSMDPILHRMMEHTLLILAVLLLYLWKDFKIFRWAARCIIIINLIFLLFYMWITFSEGARDLETSQMVPTMLIYILIVTLHWGTLPLLKVPKASKCEKETEHEEDT